MKAKSRRRLLISSVAMLLVAMLALGTATFAWFTTDTTTKADGVQMATTKKSVLLLSDDGTNTDNWVQTFSYNFNKDVQPASSNDGVNWYTAEAAVQTAYDAKDGTGQKIGDSEHPMDSYVFAQQINVYNAGSVALKNVKLEFTINETTTTANTSYLRYAIVPSTATALTNRSVAEIEGADAAAKAAAFVGAIKSFGDTNYTPVDHVGDNKAAVTGNVVPGAAITVTSAGAIKSKQTFNVTTGEETLDAGAAKFYKIFIWYEGQDSKCFDTNAGNAFPSFDIKASGDDVTE